MRGMSEEKVMAEALWYGEKLTLIGEYLIPFLCFYDVRLESEAVNACRAFWHVDISKIKSDKKPKLRTVCECSTRDYLWLSLRTDQVSSTLPARRLAFADQAAAATRPRTMDLDLFYFHKDYGQNEINIL